MHIIYMQLSRYKEIYFENWVFFFITGKLNLFYSEALPPRVPVILQDELFDEHELGGHGGAHKQPVLLREDLNGGGGGRNGGSLLRENEALLQQVKLRFSEKATNFDEIFILVFTLLSNA